MPLDPLASPSDPEILLSYGENQIERRREREANSHDNQTKAPIRHPDDILMFEHARAEHFLLRLTLKQLNTIAKDTRLPGEIGCSYGLSAGVVLRIQKKAQQMQRERERSAAVAHALAELGLAFVGPINRSRV